MVASPSLPPRGSLAKGSSSLKGFSDQAPTCPPVLQSGFAEPPAQSFVFHTQDRQLQSNSDVLKPSFNQGVSAHRRRLMLHQSPSTP